MQLPLNENDPALFSTEGENQYFDRKSARLNAREAARHIGALANAPGGKLVHRGRGRRGNGALQVRAWYGCQR